LKDSFNPEGYDPEEWVMLAKAAGMQYICFTAKHHDGFCMWDTKQTDYNIMNTPYGKDVLRMLADACEKHGMLLSIYYSNSYWHHEYGYNPASTHQWAAYIPEKPDTEKYRAFVRAQITELLSNYGKIYTLFWDIPPHIEDPSLNELAISLQPGILINDRGWDKGDFSTPEREYQPTPGARFTRMTEACNSVGQHAWGYREREDFYSIRYLISSIDRIMALGGSYLLNVGPNANGVITPDYASRIKAVGAWYGRVGECLECAEGDPFPYESNCKDFIATRKGGKTYFHFPSGLISSGFALTRYPSMPKSVKLLNTGEPLGYKYEFLPEYFGFENGEGGESCLHIFGIPIDELSGEAVIIEITW
jgi:alpha-L-fucosidase